MMSQHAGLRLPRFRVRHALAWVQGGGITGLLSATFRDSSIPNVQLSLSHIYIVLRRFLFRDALLLVLFRSLGLRRNSDWDIVSSR